MDACKYQVWIGFLSYGVELVKKLLMMKMGILEKAWPYHGHGIQEICDYLLIFMEFFLFLLCLNWQCISEKDKMQAHF